MTTKTGIYLRQSKDRELGRADEGLAVERDRAACLDLAGTLSWSVVDVYVDNHKSAAKPGGSRPAFDRLVEDIRSGRVDSVIAKASDRFHRTMTEWESFADLCEAYDVRLHTVHAGAIDLSTPDGQTAGGILAVMARSENKKRVARWKTSYQQRRVDLGRPFTGGPRLFGYTRDGEIIDQEADMIRSAVREIRRGGSILGVVRSWNAQGVTTTRGNAWTTQALKTLLRNQRLSGFVTIKGETVGRSTWTPILTEAQQTAVTTRLTVNSKETGKTYTARKSNLLGLVFCGECGARMVSSTRSGKTASHMRTYRCPAEGRGGKGCSTIRADYVEALVTGFAKRRLSDPRILVTINARRAESSTEAGTVVADIDRLTKRLDGIRAALSDSDDDVVTLASAARDLESKISGLRDRLGKMTPDLPLDVTDIDSWPTDLEQQRSRIRVVVDRVVITKAATTGKFDPDRVVIVPAEL